MDKEDCLRAKHVFNENYEKVTDELFQSSEFFDSKDLLQVRMEMVRAVALGESPEQVGPRFGVSGMSVRRYVRRVIEGGVVALLPGRTGPRGPRALGEDGEEFVDAYIDKHREASGREVHEELERQLGKGVSQRTVERRIALKKAGGTRRPERRLNAGGGD